MAVSLARKSGNHRPTLVLPDGNGDEAAVVPGVRVETAATLIQVCEALRGEKPLQQHIAQSATVSANGSMFGDFADVRGQQQVKRALEIAAAGSHSVLLVGPPGAGKSMLAQRLLSVLPPMGGDEALDTGALNSFRHWDHLLGVPHHAGNPAFAPLALKCSAASSSRIRSPSIVPWIENTGISSSKRSR